MNSNPFNGITFQPLVDYFIITILVLHNVNGNERDKFTGTLVTSIGSGIN